MVEICLWQSSINLYSIKTEFSVSVRKSDHDQEITLSDLSNFTNISDSRSGWNLTQTLVSNCLIGTKILYNACLAYIDHHFVAVLWSTYDEQILTSYPNTFAGWAGATLVWTEQSHWAEQRSFWTHSKLKSFINLIQSRLSHCCIIMPNNINFSWIYISQTLLTRWRRRCLWTFPHPTYLTGIVIKVRAH